MIITGDLGSIPCQVMLKTLVIGNLSTELDGTHLSNFSATTNNCFVSIGIVYCFSRKDCEDVAQGLCDQGIKARSYHADIHADFKSKTHQLWTTGQLQVILFVAY